MATWVGGTLIVVMLIVSVALHEAGHLLTAKHYGMKATQYFIGFGPRIFSFKRGETEYGLKAIPAGGYVKIVGMSPLEAGEGESEVDVRAQATAVANLPTKTQPDERRLFYTYPARQRFVVLVAGSTMHFVLAVFLTFAGLAIGGDLLHDPGTSTKISAIIPCANPDVNVRCAAGAPPSAAVPAGLRVGDQIVSVDGAAIKDWQQASGLLQASLGRTLNMTVLRDGQQVTLAVTPTARSLAAASGSEPQQVGFVGVQPALNSFPTYNVFEAAWHTPPALWSYVTGTVSALGRFPREIPKLVNGEPRGADGPAGVVDLTRVGSSIANAPETVATKAGSLLLIGAGVNFFVGVFNLLPLLPLDGGHISILWYENARAWFAKRRGKPDPGRVDLLKVMPVAYAVVVVFTGLSVLLVYAGIVNPIQG